MVLWGCCLYVQKEETTPLHYIDGNIWMHVIDWIAKLLSRMATCRFANKHSTSIVACFLIIAPYRSNPHFYIVTL